MINLHGYIDLGKMEYSPDINCYVAAYPDTELDFIEYFTCFVFSTAIPISFMTYFYRKIKQKMSENETYYEHLNILCR